MNFPEPISSLYGIVSIYESRGVKVASNGTRFICHVPLTGPLAYLHTLFAPCSEDMLQEISEIFGFPLPESYASFLRLHNGASFFQTISIYGLIRSFTRSLRDEDQAAISLADNCEIFRAVSKNDWQQGWRPVGSAAAANLHKLMINPAGTMKIRSASGCERHYGSFLELLNIVLAAWSHHFNCDGFADGDDYEGLELIAEGLASSAN